MTLLLDCTIRDGGYVNNWNFDEEFVLQGYNALDAAGAAYMEVGFANNFAKYKDVVPRKWRFLRNSDVRNLGLVKRKCKIAVMVDFGNADLSNLECPLEDRHIDMVRVAFHKQQWREAIDYCKNLKMQGYEVCANAMATVNYETKDLQELVEACVDAQVDYFYVADTYGCLTPHTLTDILNTVKGVTDANDGLCTARRCKIGLHAHNNAQNGLANALCALDFGIDIVDGTIMGMGRGAGNLATEIFVQEMASGRQKNTIAETWSLLPILSFANDYVSPILSTLPPRSGSYQLIHLMGAHFQAHPNFAEKMKDCGIFSMHQAWEIFEKLQKTNQSKYFSCDKFLALLATEHLT